MLFLALALFALAGCEPSTSDADAGPVDPVAMGAKKARACIGCHGPKGVSRVASYPSLAGLDEDYMVEQLQLFKSQQRQNPMMNAMAVNLSETDMQHLAAYFAAQPSPGGDR
ncbi:cytochrome c [Gilvimarinus sp. DA14]|uniref:c-type cytochrome n=1 Tax=Gilvimarinus sp. DA14 TaxID=2956798 RepID=UPI0020B64E08|nr:cytochrome c [Gilvimarinus sp. DA14]UTF61859.1 cytochrome c [Gilvimarinus sp. DA14]